MKRKKVSLHEYNKKLNKIIAKDWPVSDTLIALLDEANKYTVQMKKVRTK